MGEADTETLGEYVLIYTSGCFESLGVVVNEKEFIKNVNDFKKTQLELVKHARRYQQKEVAILLYQDIITKQYEIVRESPGKRVIIGDLEKIIAHVKKCKEELDREKDAYDRAVEALKYSEKK